MRISEQKLGFKPTPPDALSSNQNQGFPFEWWDLCHPLIQQDFMSVKLWLKEINRLEKNKILRKLKNKITEKNPLPAFFVVTYIIFFFFFTPRPVQRFPVT